MREISVMNKKMSVSTVVLIVLLVFAFGYIAFDKYSVWKRNQDVSLYQQGANYGYQQAILGVVQEAVKCQPVPLIVGNQTINIFAVDCMKQQAAAQ